MTTRTLSSPSWILLLSSMNHQTYLDLHPVLLGLRVGKQDEGINQNHDKIMMNRHFLSLTQRLVYLTFLFQPLVCLD